MYESDEYYDDPIEDDFDDPFIEAVGVPTEQSAATSHEAAQAAEVIHEEALATANRGNLHEALTMFKKATEVWPKKDVFWSNLGVTEMRLGLLDDALFSYTRGLRLNPKSKLIADNMNALRGTPPPLTCTRSW